MPARTLTDEQVRTILTHPRYRGSLRDLTQKMGLPKTTIANVLNNDGYYAAFKRPAEQKADQQKTQSASEAGEL